MLFYKFDDFCCFTKLYIFCKYKMYFANKINAQELLENQFIVKRELTINMNNKVSTVNFIFVNK